MAFDVVWQHKLIAHGALDTIEGPNVRWKRGGRVDTTDPIGGRGGSGQGDALGDAAAGH